GQNAAPLRPPVTLSGIRDPPCTDEAVVAMKASVSLVAEDGDGDVGMLCAVLAQAGLAVDQGPACIAILLAQFLRLVRPSVGHPPGLDRKLLSLAVPLPGRRDQAGIHDLARHGDVPSVAHGTVKA